MDPRRTRARYGAPDRTFDASHARSPEPRILAAPLADREVQLSSRHLFRALNRAGNLRILDCAGELFLRPAAPVHLYIVKAPLGELKKVLLVMSLAAGVHVLRPGVGVHGAAVAACVGVDPACS